MKGIATRRLWWELAGLISIWAVFLFGLAAR